MTETTLDARQKSRDDGTPNVTQQPAAASASSSSATSTTTAAAKRGRAKRSLGHKESLRPLKITRRQPQVDPHSHLDREGHIFVEEGTENVYDTVLFQNGDSKDLYCIMQLIEVGGADSSSKKYIVYTRNGIVGEKGQITVRDFKSQQKAKDEFEKRFTDRTTYRWRDRQHSFEEHLSHSTIPSSSQYSHADLTFTDPISLWQSDVSHLPRTDQTTTTTTTTRQQQQQPEKIHPKHVVERDEPQEEPVVHDTSTTTASTAVEAEASSPMQLEQDESDGETTLPAKEPALDSLVLDLITLISNTDTFSRELQDLGLDLEKVKMDQLSKAPVMDTIAILAKIEDSITALKTAEARHETKLHNSLAQQSKRFYERVSHVGVDPNTVISSESMLKDELDLIDTMCDVRKAMCMITSKKLAGFTKEMGIYRQLRYILTPLPKETPEYSTIQSYASNTGRRMAAPYELEIKEIFRLVDRDDTQQIAPLGNKQLLWYVGNQRISSMLRLLSEGPTIPSPRYPRSGFPFGRGVYFSDVITKSANNCCTSHQHPTGFVLLCEVELGNPHIMYNRPDNPSISLPENCHSVWAKGKTAPDMTESQKIDDAIVPLGQLRKQPDVPENSPLLYNEYIIYNPKQAVPKYLLKLNFKFTMKL